MIDNKILKNAVFTLVMGLSLGVSTQAFGMMVVESAFEEADEFSITVPVQAYRVTDEFGDAGQVLIFVNKVTRTARFHYNGSWQQEALLFSDVEHCYYVNLTGRNTRTERLHLGEYRYYKFEGLDEGFDLTDRRVTPDNIQEWHSSCQA